MGKRREDESRQVVRGGLGLAVSLGAKLKTPVWWWRMFERMPFIKCPFISILIIIFVIFIIMS